LHDTTKFSDGNQYPASRQLVSERCAEFETFLFRHWRTVVVVNSVMPDDDDDEMMMRR
jgi:hypothetical protein